MDLVVDASISAGWFLSDEDDPLARAALERLRDHGASVPHIWWYEVRNALLIGERKGRLAPSDTSWFLDQLARLPIRLEHSHSDEIVRVARTFDLACNDAAYLELAARLSVPLATLDRQLAAAADRANVSLLRSA